MHPIDLTLCFNHYALKKYVVYHLRWGTVGGRMKKFLIKTWHQCMLSFFKNTHLVAFEFTFIDLSTSKCASQISSRTAVWLHHANMKMRYSSVVNIGPKQEVPGIVEEAAAPEAVLPSGRRVEETWIGAIEPVQAVLRVLGGVAVNDVQQHHNAHRMSHIDQLLQLIWGTIPTIDNT